MRFLKKIKAGALQVVIVVSVVVVLLLMAFISLLYIQQRLKVKHHYFTECIYTTQQVFDYLATKKIENKSSELSFFTTTQKTVTTTKKQWGIFDLITVKTKINREEFTKTAFMGALSFSKPALYLRNTNGTSLVMVGHAKITGTAFLPNHGVTTGNIAGVSYYGNQLIYGTQLQSNTTLPRLTNEFDINAFLKNYENDSIASFSLKEELHINQSFQKKTLVHQQNGVIDLVNNNLKGNLIIVSDTLIRVHPESKLEDVILIAPRVEILSGVKGVFQAFASQKISVGKNCQLSYPTALVLIDKKSQLKKTPVEKKITIAKSTTIKGTICYLTENSAVNYKYQVYLDTDAKVFGEIYCQGNLELKGIVNGAVYTNAFIANQFGGVYLNHLYNGVINADNLPEQYVGLSVNKNRKSVAKWVN